ncbi:hypothetical protein M426DRAFT_59501, partial [Hypoxylon sp. CI-4A]
PLFGSAHVFYTIEFRDSLNRTIAKWIIKIPVNGTPDTWDKLCAETLRTEALTLYMIASETSIPVPEIIDADSSPHNDLHAPYLIMEYVEGTTLDQVWFRQDDEDEIRVRERRTKVLKGLAKSMLQLGKFEFERGGAPWFDEVGVLVGVGPSRELDVQAMIDRWFGNEDCEKGPLYAEMQTVEDAVEMYTALLDLYPCDTEASKGVDKLLRTLIKFIREPSGSTSLRERMKFVLTHPGLNLRNIIISEKGDVKAILGWDGVRAAPRSLGNEMLPSWLIRDFNPFVWRWQPSPEFWRNRGRKEDDEEAAGNRFEDAPWVLRQLRDEYESIIQGLKKEDGIGDSDVNITKQSLLALSLDTAVRDPRSRAPILRRILEKCSRMTEKFDFDAIVEVLGNDGQLDGYKLRCLERNFRELVDRGYVRGAVVW